MKAKQTRARTKPSKQKRVDEFPHITIECVTPQLDGGRRPVKRVEGELCEVSADIYKEGHDLIRARVRYRAPGESETAVAPLVHDFNGDRWTGVFPLDRIGLWAFTVDAWTDRFRTWRSELEKKVAAGQDVSSELLEGAALVESTARRTRFGEARTSLTRLAGALRDEGTPFEARAQAALAPGVLELVEEHYVPDDLTTYSRTLQIRVDRRAGAFAAWYELFPRSTAQEPGRHGTFRDAEGHLPRLAELGFDVVYLPPIHPVGRTFRKGRNNTLEAGPEDVGSPWAIGNEQGGHTAVEPALGTVKDFERFVRRAGELGLEIALDYALQCSPDHPWLKEHPDWFFIRPDGTIKYAENPPKKYQDIYPLNFWCEDREALWEACRDIFLFWIERGVRTFRVDNPHTKPFAFWEWCIREVQDRHPDIVFLAEAFTRPKRMKGLAKLGFTQSYTYFTWKNTTYELRDFFREMFNPEALEYMRGNFFANTPDILHEYLQLGGRPAFRIRLLLAATMSPVYGIYSGFELSENVPVREGSEEYLDSEKYQIRQRDFDAEGNLDPDIRLLNRIRREHGALQRATNLTFQRSENENVLVFRKAGAVVRTPGAPVAGGLETVAGAALSGRAAGMESPGAAPEGAAHGARRGEEGAVLENDLLIVANVDPFRAHDTMVHVPIEEMGIGPSESYVVHDLLTGVRYNWRGARNYVRVDPAVQPGHLFRVERLV